VVNQPRLQATPGWKRNPCAAGGIVRRQSVAVRATASSVLGRRQFELPRPARIAD